MLSTQNMTEIEQRAVRHELKVRWRAAVIKYAGRAKNVSRECKEMGMPRSTYYRWKKRFNEEGIAGLSNRCSGPNQHPRSTPPEVVEKIVHLRTKYHLGPQRITWYLERYHGISISCSTVYRTLIRQGLRKLPQNVGRRALHTRRYSKRVPGHHVQVDVKFLTLHRPDRGHVKRYQYTAIDDASRIRALKIYARHTQKSAIAFMDHVVKRFPFRIHTIRTDRGHEFQARFHWHVEDQGMRHVYIKARTPQLNGKVERSHRTDQEEFYQLLTYTDDVDLNNKLAEWERFYNFSRPHGAFDGKSPYEALRDLIQ